MTQGVWRKALFGHGGQGLEGQVPPQASVQVSEGIGQDNGRGQQARASKKA